MPIIIPPGTFNPASLSADDLYISIQNPPGYIQGAPTDVFGIVGTASWGPLNTAIHMGSPFDALSAWGSIGAAALTDPYDLATDLAIAFGQAASQASLEGWAVRVSDGTDTAATTTISGTATSAAETVTVGGTINAGDVCSLIVTCAAISGSPITLSYTVQGNDNTTTIAAALARAVNNNSAIGSAGIEATSTGAVVSIYQPTTLSPQATYAKAIVGTARCTATVGGTSTAADTIELTFTNAGIGGWPANITYTVLNGDTTTSIAAGLAALINGASALTNAGVSASSVGPALNIAQVSAVANATVLTKAIGGSATETVTFTNGGDLVGGPDATLTLGAGPSVSANIILAGLYTGILGNSLQALVSAGAGANTYNVTLSLASISAAELYPNIPASTFWASLATAITKGMSNVRGPSQIVKVVSYAGVGAPTLGTYTFAGGTDGRAGVTTSILIGNNASLPMTGLYALSELVPAVGVVWFVGCTDPLVPPILKAFAQAAGFTGLHPFPTGTSTATALANVQSYGTHDSSFAYVKDWIYWFDVINNVVRLVPPTAFIGGKIATLSPCINPGNEPVNLVEGTERYNPTTGDLPYTSSEVGQLANAGIMFITNPIPAGSIWGIRHGQTTSLQPATQGVEWWRMSVFLARSFASTMGQFVDANQSQKPNDPLRNAIKLQLNHFLQFLKSPAAGAGDGNGLIDDYSVICTFNASPTATAGNGVNTPTSIAQHYLFVLVRVTYLSAVRFFVLSLQGGTTVVSVGATQGQQLA